MYDAAAIVLHAWLGCFVTNWVSGWFRCGYATCAVSVRFNTAASALFRRFRFVTVVIIVTILIAARCYMRKLGYTVVRCPSVCLSRSCILSKRKTYLQIFFHLRVAIIILVFSYQTLWQYSDGQPPNWGRNRDFRPISGFAIDDCWSIECGVSLDNST